MENLKKLHVAEKPIVANSPPHAKPGTMHFRQKYSLLQLVTRDQEQHLFCLHESNLTAYFSTYVT